MSNCNKDFTCTNHTIYASSRTHLGSVQGSHLIYSRVEEIIQSNTNSSNAGKIVYYFHQEELPESRELYDVTENGQLQKREIYDANDKLLEKTEYSYSTDGPTDTHLGRYRFFPRYAAIAMNNQDNHVQLCKKSDGSFEWLPLNQSLGDFVDRDVFRTKMERKQRYNIQVKWVYKTQEKRTQRFYHDNGTLLGDVVTTTDYTYSDTMVTLPTQTQLVNSDGKTYTIEQQYLSVTPLVLPYNLLRLSKRWASPIRSKYFIDNQLTYQTELTYGSASDGIRARGFYEKYGLHLLSLRDSIEATDIYSNVLQLRNIYGEASALLWGHAGLRMLAQVQNARYEEVAFTSFDTHAAAQGKWTIPNPTQNITFNQTIAKTGRGYFAPASNATIQTGSLPAGKYKVAYFTKDTLNTSIGGQGGVLLNSRSSQQPDAQGWYYVQHEISMGNGSIVLIHVNGTAIDELRLYPIDALMTSYSYNRETRLLESITEPNGIPSRFEYDKLYRLEGVRNFDNHYLQKTDYQYSSSTMPNRIRNWALLKEGVTNFNSINNLPITEVQPLFSYFDGIGREAQSIEVKGSPQQRDVVSLAVWDQYARAAEQYLPYSIANAGNPGAYRPNALAEQQAFMGAEFGSTESTYGKRILDLEASPLNRVFKERPPGEDFYAHPKETKYQSNVANEVRNFHTTNAWYAANSLLKVIATDENGNALTTYTDKIGRVLMQDREGSKTYFLYNNQNLLEQVITPEGAKLGHSNPSYTKSTTNVAEKSYLYTYDQRYRMASKKVPGAMTYYYYYNELDQVVLTKDGNGFQLFTKYDALGRPVMSGRYKGTTIPNSSQSTFEVANSTAPHYYSSNQAFPTDGNIDVYTVNYYDDYNLDNDNNHASEVTYQSPSNNASNYPSSHYPFAEGQLTGTKTAILNKDNSPPSTFLNSYSFYDKFGRIVHTQMDNHLGGRDVEWNSYNYPGWLLRNRKEHNTVSSQGNQSLVINQRFTYDHRGRSKQSFLKIGDSGIEQLLCEKSYNERNELATKKIGATAADGYLQTLNYSYNIRQWLTKMNDIHNQGNDLFAMELVYGEGDANFSQILYGNGANANYNGNISMIKWSGAGSDKQVYGFTYDGLNRLSLANYGLQTATSSYNLNHHYTGQYAYDDNSNINAIHRNAPLIPSGNNMVMDNMTLSYFGDGRLQKVTETGDKAQGFVTKNTGNLNYDYDFNGNLTKDPDKGLRMAYNHLNLPHELSDFYEPTIIPLVEWLYDAAGNKLQKKVLLPDTLKVNDIPMASREYLANQVITSTGKVAEGSDVGFIAGNSICLDNGFEVELGAEFLADIQPTQDMTRDYCQNIEYVNGQIEAVYHEAGRVVFDGNSQEFQYRLADHLGNTRILFRDNGSGIAELLQENHYYAFGMQMNGAWNNRTTPLQSYLYNNKEVDTNFGLNLYFYGARMFDFATCRFTGVDPISDDFPHLSPYNYASNDPIKNIDLHGLQGIRVDEYFKPEPQCLGCNPVSDELPDAEQTVYEQLRTFTVTHEIDNPNADRQVEAMMEIFSPDNVGLTLGIYSPSKLPNTKGSNLTLPLVDDAVSAAVNIEKGAWAQTTFRTSFSKKGQEILSEAARQPVQSIDDAVGALQSGKLSVNDLPIDVIVREGNTLILNTRSSVTLTKAGVSRNHWNIVNRTGQELYENLLNGQLQRNNLTNVGTYTIRQSGTQNTIRYTNR